MLVMSASGQKRTFAPQYGMSALPPKADIGDVFQMTPAELESFVIAESAAAWAALIEMDRDRGGTGELRDTAVSLMRNRTMIAVHCGYRDDDRTLTAWFKLPEPLPPDEDIERGEIVGDWQRCNGGFLLRLHASLEGRQPAPKLFAPEPQLRETVH
jgi:hypothetical protein